MANLANAHYVDAGRNDSSSVATSTVSFTSSIEAPEIVPDPAKTQISTPQELQDIEKAKEAKTFADLVLLNTEQATKTEYLLRMQSLRLL